MPLYEYECSACKQRFERIEKFSDKPTKKCVKCGGPARRLLSSPAIQFKGTGWYVTDYAKSGGASESKPAEGGSSSEVKPAASTPAKDTPSKPSDSAKP